MQILFIIGNGFDLNLGLNTSYHHFYNHYKSIISEKPIIQNLKENISDKYESWSDLEIALGNYTKNLEKIDDLDEILIDIGEELSKYLLQEENKLKNFKIDKKKFFDDLCYPENVFLPADKEKISDFEQSWINNSWNLDIFTLNYTTIIEKLFQEEKGHLLLAKRSNNNEIRLGEIKHIHGFLDNDMVIGVNDISQIANETFRTNLDVLESIVKSACNTANRNNIDRQFTSKINAANLICIFGSSIGDTDKKWWQLIGNRLKYECNLIIFSKGAEIPSRIRHMQARAERSVKNLFLDKTNLSEKDKENVVDKIYIGLNTKMFSEIMIKE